MITLIWRQVEVRQGLRADLFLQSVLNLRVLWTVIIKASTRSLKWQQNLRSVPAPFLSMMLQIFFWWWFWKNYNFQYNLAPPCDCNGIRLLLYLRSSRAWNNNKISLRCTYTSLRVFAMTLIYCLHSLVCMLRCTFLQPPYKIAIFITYTIIVTSIPFWVDRIFVGKDFKLLPKVRVHVSR